MRPFKTLEQRKEFFLSRIQKDENGCWLWLGKKNHDGYGMMYSGEAFSRHGRPKQEMCHRIAYRWFKGEIPLGLELLHSCKNKHCVNPEHLSSGTHTENMRQSIIEGTFMGGNMRPNQKLKESDVRDIRNAYWQWEMSAVSIAKHYGIDRRTVHSIIARTTWKNVN